MRTENYRGYDIECTVIGANPGKLSVKWHCHVLLTPPGQDSKFYELDLIALTRSTARGKSIRAAKELIDTEIGPERFRSIQDVSSIISSHGRSTSPQKRIGKKIACLARRIGLTPPS